MTNEEIALEKINDMIDDCNDGEYFKGIECDCIQYPCRLHIIKQVIQENTKLKVENKRLLEKLYQAESDLQISDDLQNENKLLLEEMNQIMANSYPYCDLRQNGELCTECYRYEICLNVLRGKVEE